MVLISSHFTLVTGILYNLYTLNSPEGTLFRCLLACYQHQSCGGIIYHENESFKCEFVVEPTVAGASPSISRKAYRLDMYGDKRLWELFTEESTISWEDTDSLCQANSLLMPNYPVTEKQRIVLSLRNTIYLNVDLRRQEDGSYQSSAGEVTDAATIAWVGNNPHMGSQLCIQLGMRDNLLSAYDEYCYLKFDINIFCV